MKKIYFTKFLPVEGEIKRGDKYLHPNGNIQQLAKDVQLSLLPEINKTGKLVKLFLCSRDIQVGDKFIHPHDLTNTFIAREDTIDWHSAIGTFKVIGEVSSEATWVKEGDEFSIDDLAQYNNGKPGTLGIYLLQEDELKWINPKTLIVLIRCPTCKKFH